MYSDQEINLLNIGYFQLARTMSRHSDCKIKVGAVIANKKPISASFNTFKTHPKYSNPYETNVGSIHAEIRAVILSGQDLKGGSIYVYREYKTGKPAMSRPCRLCMEVLKEAGIKKVYYTIGKKPYFRLERLR